MNNSYKLINFKNGSVIILSDVETVEDVCKGISTDACLVYVNEDNDVKEKEIHNE
jgi:hypothetical protein